MAELGQPNPSPAEPGPRPLPRDRPLGPDEPCALVDVPPEAPRPGIGPDVPPGDPSGSDIRA
ncbi:hypothetical protein [Methylobacterium hispanicum]|uniref:hypothetical protein n=1 Tax=Methylobacterium hispanicum TaxID=270350 RepID=UPI002F2CE247